MSDSAGEGFRPDEAALREMVAESDTGARHPAGLAGKVLLWVAIAWSLFQLWYASRLPFILHFFVRNDTEARALLVNDRRPAELVRIPALLLLGAIIWLQRRRATPEAPAAAAPVPAAED
jgi:TRAP-type uncharacterized transport system fused permease subunit